MTPLRQRMTDDMTVRGLAENTKKSYLNSVAGLARHYRRSPDRISAPEVQDYLLHLHEQKGLTWQSCNCVRHGVRFLYRTLNPLVVYRARLLSGGPVRVLLG